MARITPDRDLSPIISAAQNWASSCLIEDQSILSTESLWTSVNLTAVRHAFVDRPDESDADFWTKLLKQMSDAPAGAKKLMAEMMWITLLFPSTIKAGTKRTQILNLWSQSGGSLPELHPMLSDSVLSGVGSAGMGFNNHRWRELCFLVEFAEHLKELPQKRRGEIIRDYDQFLGFIDTVPQNGHRQLRHMLRYFLFPDRVERMSSSATRRRVLTAFRDLSSGELKQMNHRQLDEALFTLRQELQRQYPGQVLDFYSAPLRAKWLVADEEEESEITFDGLAVVGMWECFRREYPDFIDFQHPGERFEDAELHPKRRGLERFSSAGGRNEILRLLNAGNPEAALQVVLKSTALNIASFQSWRPSVGMGKPDSLDKVLRAFLAATEQPYVGPITLEPVFSAIMQESLAPAWDTTSVLLWTLRPSDYFPIKISYYRELAAKLGIQLESGRPTAELFDSVHRFGKAIWAVAASRKPRDWVDVQSFLWVLCQSYEQTAEQSKLRVPLVSEPSVPVEPLPVTSTAKNIWQIAPGENARLWEDCCRDGMVVIGWDSLGDLQGYRSQGAIEAALQAHDKSEGRRFNDARCCWEFAHVMAPGDIVVAKQGRYKLLGVGRVTSEYLYRPDREEYHHLRKVHWLRREMVEVEESMTVKTLTSITSYPEFTKRILEALGEPELVHELYGASLDGVVRDGTDQSVSRTVDLEDFDREVSLQRLFMPEQQFDGILDQLKRKKNVILQGPPGVGKTFVAQTLAYALMGKVDPSRVQMVQFHQSYGYEEFIQGLRPTATGAFVPRKGIFLSFCERAAEDTHRPWVFVIDEINRGNLSKILGELMMLIEADKREVRYALPLAYDDPGTPKFFVPPNVHIIGLMNTADRSLAMVDYALRRRFAFVSLQSEIGSAKFKSYLVENKVPLALAEVLIECMQRLNEKIRQDSADLGEGFCIGHSYLCPPACMSDPKAWLESVLEYDIRPLLIEYWMEKSERHQLAETEIAEIRKLLA